MSTDRRKWCAALAKLVSPSFPVDAAKALGDMLPALHHMPESLFTEETLIHVANWPRRQTIPAFNEITAALNDFRRTYVPDDRLRLAPPRSEPTPDPTPEAIAYVTNLLTAHREEVAAARIVRERADLRTAANVTLQGAALAELRRQRRVRLGLEHEHPENDDAR